MMELLKALATNSQTLTPPPTTLYKIQQRQMNQASEFAKMVQEKQTSSPVRSTLAAA